MFRRPRTSSTATDPAAPLGASSGAPSGAPSEGAGSADAAMRKGRPTPTRKEAEEARRLRARNDAKGVKGVARYTKQQRTEQRRKIREGMKSGEEKYLMPRDKGPVRRFLRDRVDVRLSAAEFLLPLLIVIMFLQYSPSSQLQNISNSLWASTLLVVALDTSWLLVTTRRELRRRFSDDTRGWWGYLLLRALQIRPLRLPKARLKIGDSLPEHYR